MSKLPFSSAKESIKNEYGEMDPIEKSESKVLKTKAKLGQFIHQNREEIGLTKKDLAQATDISEEILDQIEHGHIEGEYLTHLLTLMDFFKTEFKIGDDFTFLQEDADQQKLLSA